MDKIFNKVFIWLAIGLLISFGAGYYLSTNTVLLTKILSIGMAPIIILELVVAFIFSFFIRKISKTASIVLYIIYSLLTGLTLSFIFLSFKISSIAITFLATSIVFILLAIYGYVTKRDVTKIGTILLFGLLGELILIILNALIFKSNSLDMATSVISLIIFLGYIVYDINIVKRRMYDIDEDKLAIYGAFQLYLDFINVFIDLLRFFGKSKD